MVFTHETHRTILFFVHRYGGSRLGCALVLAGNMSSILKTRIEYTITKADIVSNRTPKLLAEWPRPFSDDYNVLVSVHAVVGSGSKYRTGACQTKTPTGVQVSAHINPDAMPGDVIAFEIVATGVLAAPVSMTVN